MNRSFSKFNKLKIKLLALSVSLMVVVEAGLMTGETFANKDKIDISSNLIAIDSEKNTERFEVSVKKEAVSKDEGADIVLCIDTSASMNQERGTVPNQYTKLDKVKEAVREFYKGFTDEKTGSLVNGVRIGICEFSHESNMNAKERNGYVKIGSDYYKAGDREKGSSKDAKEICALTNNIDQINKSLDNLNKSKQGEINLQAGIDCAGNMLEKNNAKKYIVLFTNGAPNISNDHGYGNSYENVYAKAGDKEPNGKNIESLAYLKDGKWNRCLKSKLNDVHFKGAQRAYNNLLGGIPGIISEKAPMYKNDELKVYSISDTSDLNKKAEENKGAIKYPYDENSEYAKVNNLLKSINNTDGFKEVVDINKVSDSFKEVEKSIEKESEVYPLANAKCEVEVSEECILPSADELKGQLGKEIKNKVIKDIEVDNSNRKVLFTLGDVKDKELTFRYDLKFNDDTDISYEASKYEAFKTIDTATIDTASSELGMDKVNITIQSKVFDSKTKEQINPPQLSEEAKEILADNPYTIIENEIYATYPILLRGDKGAAYNFKSDPDNIGSDDNVVKIDCLMKDDSVSMDKIADYFKNHRNPDIQLIKMETYKISEIVPMFNTLDRIRVITKNGSSEPSEVVYEGDNINNAQMKLEKGVTNVSIVFENSMTDELSWFSKFYVDGKYDRFDP